jgi:hypothetical protein
VTVPAGALAGILSDLIQAATGAAKRWSRERAEWAAANPEAAAIQALRWAHVAEHRAEVLEHKRVAVNRKKRIARVLSAAAELREYSDELLKIARKAQCDADR